MKKLAREMRLTEIGLERDATVDFSNLAFHLSEVELYDVINCTYSRRPVPRVVARGQK